MKYRLYQEAAIGYWKTVGYQLVHDCFDRINFAIYYQRESENAVYSSPKLKTVLLKLSTQ